jgi:hypothetical protein
MLESLILLEPRLIAAAAKARVADFSPTHREREREISHMSVPSHSSKIKALTSYRFASDPSQNDIRHTNFGIFEVDYGVKSVIENNLHVAY